MVNCPVIDGWIFEDVLRWSTVDGRESPVSRVCSMRPPMSGTHRWSRPKAGASHWGGVPPQTARPRSAKKAAVAVIHHVVGRPVSSRRYTIFPISPNDWRLGEGGSRMSLCWIAYLKPLPYSLTWFLTGRDLISGSGFWYLSVCRRSVSPWYGRVLK